jgi:hypothetical protein
MEYEDGESHERMEVHTYAGATDREISETDACTTDTDTETTETG